MEATDRLELDGCPIGDLGLDLTLPGNSNIELRKGGKDMAVTPHNLDEYCKVKSFCLYKPVHIVISLTCMYYLCKIVLKYSIKNDCIPTLCSSWWCTGFC